MMTADTIPDDVADLLIEQAAEHAMGGASLDGCLDAIRRELGRDLRPHERAQWLDDVATGLEIAEAL